MFAVKDFGGKESVTVERVVIEGAKLWTMLVACACKQGVQGGGLTDLLIWRLSLVKQQLHENILLMGHLGAAIITETTNGNTINAQW